MQAAAKIAEQSALRASKLAAAAGQDYVAPEGLGVELPPVEKVGGGKDGLVCVAVVSVCLGSAFRSAGSLLV